MLLEFGKPLGITSLCDSSAAKGILCRSGVGRIKHLEVRHLWVQGFVREGVVSIKWIPRAQNPADGLTHATSRADFCKYMDGLCLQFPDSLFRSATALQCVAEGVLESEPSFSLMHACDSSVLFLTFGCSHSSLVVSCGSRKTHLQAPSSFRVAERRSLCYCCSRQQVKNKRIDDGVSDPCRAWDAVTEPEQHVTSCSTSITTRSTTPRTWSAAGAWEPASDERL